MTKHEYRIKYGGIDDKGDETQMEMEMAWLTATFFGILVGVSILIPDTIRQKYGTLMAIIHNHIAIFGLALCIQMIYNYCVANLNHSIWNRYWRGIDLLDFSAFSAYFALIIAEARVLWKYGGRWICNYIYFGFVSVIDFIFQPFYLLSKLFGSTDSDEKEQSADQYAPVETKQIYTASQIKSQIEITETQTAVSYHSNCLNKIIKYFAISIVIIDVFIIPILCGILIYQSFVCLITQPKFHDPHEQGGTTFLWLFQLFLCWTVFPYEPLLLVFEVLNVILDIFDILGGVKSIFDSFLEINVSYLSPQFADALRLFRYGYMFISFFAAIILDPDLWPDEKEVFRLMMIYMILGTVSFLFYFLRQILIWIIKINVKITELTHVVSVTWIKTIYRNDTPRFYQ
eukprot:156048_1